MKSTRPPRDRNGAGDRGKKPGKKPARKPGQQPGHAPPPKRGSYSQRLIATSKATVRDDGGRDESGRGSGNRDRRTRADEPGENKVRGTNIRSGAVGVRSGERDGRTDRQRSPTNDDGKVREAVRDSRSGPRIRRLEKRGPQLLDASEARRVENERKRPLRGESRGRFNDNRGQRQDTRGALDRAAYRDKAGLKDRSEQSDRGARQTTDRNGEQDRSLERDRGYRSGRQSGPWPASPTHRLRTPSPSGDATDVVFREPVRIAKAMARAGLCSRREAERWIEDGRVSVNGKVLSSPALDVGPRDTVKVDGNLLPLPETARLWRYHKPKGLMTTHADPEGRATVFDSLPPDMPRVVSIGRLDYNSEGLLLLTNDGELARHLELPATGWLRRYRVRAYGRLTQDDLDPLREGITVDGLTYGPIEATLDSVQSGNMWLTVGLREGKNREVRKILGALGLEVNRLIRVSFGPFQLLDLEPGAAEHVRRRVLADQLGPELAAEFGLLGPFDDEAAGSAASRGGGKTSFKVRSEPFGLRRGSSVSGGARGWSTGHSIGRTPERDDRAAARANRAQTSDRNNMGGKRPGALRSTERGGQDSRNQARSVEGQDSGYRRNKPGNRPRRDRE